MRGRIFKLLRVAVVAVAASLALTACGSSTTTYGSSWAKFTASFPSTPTVAAGAQLADLQKEFPGTTGLNGYYVGGGASLFATNAPVPAPPVYFVFEVRYKTASNVSDEISELHKLLKGLGTTAVNGFNGVRNVSLASKSPFAEGSKVTDPSSYWGVMALGSNGVLILVQVVTTTEAAASSFLDSVKPQAS